MARSLNKVQLIGNLTRDPELRYTPQGTAVCTFSVATNRQWKTDSGDMRDEAEFHRVVAWDKLADICAQLLSKGKRVYIEGRLQSRRWTGQDNVERTTFEVVASDMLLLDRVERDPDYADAPAEDLPDSFDESEADKAGDAKKPEKKESKKSTKKKDAKKEEDIPEDDIPF